MRCLTSKGLKKRTSNGFELAMNNSRAQRAKRWCVGNWIPARPNLNRIRSQVFLNAEMRSWPHLVCISSYDLANTRRIAFPLAGHRFFSKASNIRQQSGSDSAYNQTQNGHYWCIFEQKCFCRTVNAIARRTEIVAGQTRRYHAQHPCPISID